MANHPTQSCTYVPVMVTKYQKRISDPLLDPIDIQIEIPALDYEKLIGDRLGNLQNLFATGFKPHVIYKRDILSK